MQVILAFTTGQGVLKSRQKKCSIIVETRQKKCYDKGKTHKDSVGTPKRATI